MGGLIHAATINQKPPGARARVAGWLKGRKAGIKAPAQLASDLAGVELHNQ